jgi:hypothetical protein
MAGEAAELGEIGRLEVAKRSAAKRDHDRGSVVLEQRRERHHAVEILRPEPIGVKLGSNERVFRHDHPIGQGLAFSRDLLPNSVIGSEPLIGRVELGADAGRAEAAEFMGLHVLHAETGAGGADEIRNLRQRQAPGSVIHHAIVDQADERVVVVDHSGASPPRPNVARASPARSDRLVLYVSFMPGTPRGPMRPRGFIDQTVTL